MSENNSQLSANKLYAHPFSKEYWRQAAGEFRNVKMLIFAALMIALRVALKAVSIPIGMDLRINTAFFINAYGAMVFGPVVAIAAAAISDTLGCLLFPTGVYFFPFIFIEIAGSLIFALFLYRAEVSTMRIVLSRFCIDFFVNIVLNTPVMMLYYSLMLGKYYTVIDLPRIFKNLALFPVESILLILFMRAVLPQTKRMGLAYSGIEKLRFTKRNVTAMVVLLIVGAASVGGYLLYSYNNTSLSASYTAQERYEHNEDMNAIVLENHPELADVATVSIVESALPKFRSDNITYSVAVYTVDEQALAENTAAALAENAESDYGLETLKGYSKSKARKDTSLVSKGMATIVVNKNTGETVSYQDDFE